MCFLFSLKLLFETLLIIRRIQRDIVIEVKTSSCKLSVIFVRFQLNLNFLDRFWKKVSDIKFNQIRSVGAELFHADGQTDGRTHITKLIVAFRNFAKVPNKIIAFFSFTCCYKIKDLKPRNRLRELSCETVHRYA